VKNPFTPENAQRWLVPALVGVWVLAPLLALTILLLHADDSRSIPTPCVGAGDRHDTRGARPLDSIPNDDSKK
jgi:hypothetical protein